MQRIPFQSKTRASLMALIPSLGSKCRLYFNQIADNVEHMFKF